MSHLFQVDKQSDWEDLKTRLPVRLLGNQHLKAMIMDLKSRQGAYHSDHTDIEVLNDVKRKFVAKLGEDSSPQKIIDAITTSPIIVADAESRWWYKLQTKLHALFPICFSRPTRYRWLLQMNAPAVALIKHYQEAITQLGGEIEELNFTAIAITWDEVTAEKIINANTNFINIMKHTDFS